MDGPESPEPTTLVGTGTTGREVAKAAMDGPQKAAAASRASVILPHSTMGDGVKDMGEGHRGRPGVPGLSRAAFTNF